MKTLKEVMSGNVACLSPEASMQEVATKMKELDAGSIPVCENDRLIGMVTDRDIVVKGVAGGIDLKSACARDVMTTPVVYCFEDQEIGEAARVMEAKQIRRLLVLNRDKRLVGIVSLGDLSIRAGSEDISYEVLESVSEPRKGAVA